MTFPTKMPIYVVIVVIVFIHITGNYAEKSQLHPRFGRTIKERLASESINLSISCLQDFSLYLQRLEEGETWALKMFDSSAKPESGVLEGVHSFLGFYSECIDALPRDAAGADTNDNLTVQPDFTSIYCLSTLHLTPENKTIHKVNVRPLCDQLEGADLTFAVCAPSSCTEDDVGKIAVLSFGVSGCRANLTSTVCRQPKEPLFKDGPALAVAVVLTTLAAVVLGATLFDCKRRKDVPKRTNSRVTVGDLSNTNYSPHVGSQEPKPVTRAEKAVLCFSLLSNGNKLFGVDGQQRGSIRVLHGLRFFSMTWVICTHSWYASVEMSTFRNMNLYENTLDFKTKFVTHGVLAIDTFFFMGGLVLAYSTLKQLRKNGGQINWLLFYVHRYLRTMPMVMIVVAICAFLASHFGDGPRWADFVARYETNCRISWWTYPLYIQNFVLLDHQCLLHTWYSAADFQIYLISPPILYALYKKPRLGVAIIAVLSLASITLAATYHIRMFMDEDFLYERDVYNKPYFRVTPYLMGMLMGLLLSERQALLPPKKQVYILLGWLVCAFCLLFPILGRYTSNKFKTMPLYGIFKATVSPLWSIGIAWIVYACVAGCGGIFTTVLTTQALEPLSKLTFSTYIIHSPALRIIFANLEDSLYYDFFVESYFFAGNLLLSYGVAVIFCLFIELPIANIERLVLGSK